MKYCYIINPTAGQKPLIAKQIPLIEHAFARTKLPYEIAVTEYSGHATELVKRMSDENDFIRVCSMGGDGTLNEVSTGAIGRDNIEIGCYPCGSGNDFIKCFGSREHFFNFEYILDADSIDIDVIRVNDRYCVNIFSLGLDANVANDIPYYRHLPLVSGPMAYNMSLLVNFVKKLGTNVRLTIGDKSETVNSLLLAVCNGQVYGGGFKAAPEAIVNDGLLDVLSVSVMKRPRIAKVIPTYKNGLHIASGEIIDSLRDVITYIKTPELHIQTEKETLVNLDGEVTKMKEMDISLIPKGIKFLLPNSLKSSKIPERSFA
ncbi:MAG: diacylglycerol kinase family lipid kinase [Oscillospiraceae bacterium]|nr:diacylglycerol kinase family lipid kinase [Oscillospiraceae bacterium]